VPNAYPDAYEVLGDGPTIVFTHGWMMNRKVWGRQRSLADQFRLIFWDPPQEGAAGHPLTLDDCAGALHELMTAENVTAATYVGWSMGMSIFWRYLEQYGEGPFNRVLNVEMLPRLELKETRTRQVAQAMRRDRAHATGKFTKRIFAAPKPEEVACLVKDAAELPLESVLNVYREMAEADFTRVAAGYSGVQHLLFGRLGFYANREELIRQYFPKDSLQWFEQSAHAPFWEEAEKFNHVLSSLFSGDSSHNLKAQ